MTLSLVLLTAFILGVVAGLRSMTAPAVVAWAVWLGWIPIPGARATWLGSGLALAIITLAAVGELIADKLPFTPDRTKAGSIVVRILSGAACAYVLANSSGLPPLPIVLIGIAGAAIGTFSGHRIRQSMTVHIGHSDFPIALGEDCIAISAALVAVKFL